MRNTRAQKLSNRTTLLLPQRFQTLTDTEFIEPQGTPSDAGGSCSLHQDDASSGRGSENRPSESSKVEEKSPETLSEEKTVELNKEKSAVVSGSSNTSSY